MKARILAEKLMENPDFDVKFSFTEEDGSEWGLACRSFENIDISDIGYSDGVIVLSGEESCYLIKAL